MKNPFRNLWERYMKMYQDKLFADMKAISMIEHDNQLKAYKYTLILRAVKTVVYLVAMIYAPAEIFHKLLSIFIE